MKAMNYESTKWSRDAIDDVVVDDAVLAKRRRRRRIIIAVVALLAVAVLAVFLLGGRGEKAAAPQGAQGEQLPSVTFVVPGRQDIVANISATGSLAARRDMPVGVAGEGGQVDRVLVEPGQWVAAGQTLAIINRSVQSQQAAQLAAAIEVARADMRLAQNQLDRAQALVSRGFISQADLDQKRATRDAAAARVRVAEAQLGQTRAQIGRLDVRSPTAGLVLQRNVEAGQVVGAGSGALFRVASGGEMELRALLSQADLARVHVGTIAQVTPVGSTTVYQGSVWLVSPMIDPQSRQGEARVLVPYNRDLRPGGFATVNFQAGTMSAPLLPESAIQSDAQGNYVYVIGPDNKVVRRGVTVGDTNDRGVAIAAGLNGNEHVVLTAGAFLNPGQRVRPEHAPAAATPAAPPAR
jgi:RND family efflux transporter MFP subunit